VKYRRLLGVGEATLRRVAGRLPPQREEALLAVAEAAFALITGRVARSAGARRAEPRIDGAAQRRAELALERGDIAKAAAEIDALYRKHPTSFRVVRLRREILSRMGELSEATRMLHELHVLDDHPANWDKERVFLGRLIETTPGWLPRIPGPARPVEPASDTIVLQLVKESLPYLITGFTVRTRYNLLAARQAGIEPIVVTALGFPRLLGIEPAGTMEMVEGIPHHRLDLGPHYPLDRPVDQILEDQAWLTAEVARRVRPALIHASSGHRGFEHALVGAALRAHIGRPLVYEVRSFFESTWSADEDWNEVGEQFHRRFDTESRAMKVADHVITIAESMRAEIIERGVKPDRVSVIPNGVDADVFSPRPPDPDLIKRYGLAGAFTFGYVSNLDHPRENQELLVEATAILLRRGRRVRCLIVGDGRRRSEVEAAARRAHVGDAVVFTGRVPHAEAPAHYALLDAFVVPRRDERAARMVTPLKPFEALAMARPLVVADLPALHEIAQPEARGLAFPVGDAAALAATLERLIDDPALGERLGAAGRTWVARERSWNANGPRFRDLYRSVLEEWERHPRSPA
jgi:glycosyltransferase involved in cell wall biosynthesis